MLKIEIERNGIIENTRIMTYSSDNEFFTALVTVCDELGIDVPIWKKSEERILLRKKILEIQMDNEAVLRISSKSELQC
jgi:hypothetical protein